MNSLKMTRVSRKTLYVPGIISIFRDPSENGIPGRNPSMFIYNINSNVRITELVSLVQRSLSFGFYIFFYKLIKRTGVAYRGAKKVRVM